MPKLVDPTNISRNRANAVVPVTTYDGGVEGRAIQHIGQAVEQEGARLDVLEGKRKAKRDRYEWTVAEGDMIRIRAEAEEAAKGEEYGGMVDAYNKYVGDNEGSASEKITDLEQRALFSATQRKAQYAREGIVRGRAWVGEVDDAKGTLTNIVAANREVAINGNTEESLGNVYDVVDSMIDSGYLSKVEGEKVRQSVGQDYAVTRIEMAPPSERFELIENLGQYIPDDVEKKLLEIAKEDDLSERAYMAADNWRMNDLSVKEMQAEAKKIEDADLRNAATSRFKELEATERNGKIAKGYDTFQELALKMEKDTSFTYEMIPPESLADMTQSQRGMLRKVEADLRNPPTVKIETPMDVYAKADGYLKQGNYSKVREVLVDNFANISPADKRHFIEESNELAAGASNTVYTGKQMIDNYARETGLKGRKGLLLRTTFDGWFSEYRRNHDGTAPDGEAQKKAVETLIFDQPEWGAGRVFEDENAIEVAGQKVRDKEATEEMVGVPKSLIKEAKDLLEANGKEANPEAVYSVLKYSGKI